MHPDKFYVIDRCGVCHSTDSSPHIKDGKFSINCCNYCSTYWVTPRLKPKHLKEIYQTIYWKSDSPKDLGYEDYLKHRSLYKKTFVRRFKNLKPFMARYENSPKRVLDIGCSNGVFLSMMSENNWSGIGIDVSEYIIEEAQKANKSKTIEYRSGYLNEVIEELEKFEMITMWDVIEHVEDPIDLVKQVHKHLNDKGLLILETQNIKSLFAKILGRSWHHFKHFEHIYHFNREALEYMLTEAGFKIKNISTANSGKYIDVNFLLERSQRVLPAIVHRLVNRCFKSLKTKTLYANMHDEYIVIAEKI